MVRSRSRELFILTIIFIGFGTAWLTAQVGLSLALGAFIAGLAISESEYSHQALGNILPFRDVFASFFFISIGMLLDVDFLLKNPGIIALLTLGVLLVKALLAGSAALFLKFPLRTAVLVGLALCQVGEFSFILSKVGQSQGLFSGDSYQLFLDVTIITMVATPLMMALAPRTADFILRWPLPQRLKLGALALYTLAGSPINYYGTEAGVTQERPTHYGGYGYFEEARARMLWGSEQNDDLREYFRRLIALRKAHPTLQAGQREAVLLDGERGLYGYRRELAGESILVLLNSGKQPQRIELEYDAGEKAVELLSGIPIQVETHRLALTLPPESGAIIGETKLTDFV